MTTRIGKLLKGLAVATKLNALRKIGVNVQNPESDAELTAAFEMTIEDRGVYQMLDMLDKNLLNVVYERVLPDEVSKAQAAKKQTHVAKNAILKRVADKIFETKLVAWLEAQDLAFLQKIATAIEIKDPAKGKKELAIQIREEILSIGSVDVFFLLESGALREICKQADIKITEDHTKAQIVSAIATGVVEEAEKKEKKPQVKPSEKKPDIAKGISAIDLQTHYYVGELAKYCDEKNIKSNGSKKELIKRILKWLNGDKSVEKSAKKGSKKRSTTDEAATAAASVEKKEKQPSKKQKKAEEVAAAAEKPKEEKKAEEKKVEEKKAPEKKVEEKKAPEKKVEEKKAPEKKVEEKKAPEKKKGK